MGSSCCCAPAFRGGSGTVSSCYGSHAYTRCRAERVRRGDDAQPHPATHAPDIHPRRGVDIRPRCSGKSQPGPQGTQATPNLTQSESQGPQPAVGAAQLHTPGPYNPAAALPPKVVKRILALEFVEMTELRANV